MPARVLYPPAPPTYVHSWASPESELPHTGDQSNAGASAVWTTTNRALYVPFSVREPYSVRRMWVSNGAAVSGNIDLGLYDSTSGLLPGTRLASSGSTAQSGTTALQIVDITDVYLVPGKFYWMALAIDNTTATVFRSATTSLDNLILQRLEASAFPLPATATSTVANISSNPFFGITSLTTP